jgi:hypothetical protein
MGLKLKPKVKARWIELLKDPKIKPGRCRLRTFEDGEYYYCALGVLGLAIQDVCHIGKFDDDGRWFSEDGDMGDCSIDLSLFKEVVEPGAVAYDMRQMMCDVITANDIHDMVFDQVASAVEIRY